MCKVRDVTAVLEEYAPPRYAESWDTQNIGLSVGDFEKDVKGIYVCVDVTEKVVGEAVSKGSDLIVSHHPLIFGGIRKINSEDFLGRRIIRLIKNGISSFAMHTNYDVAHMADIAAQKLKMKEIRPLEVLFEEEGTLLGIGKSGILENEITVRELCGIIKKEFGLDTVKVFGDMEMKAFKISICPGSGKSLVSHALENGSCVYVTGDIDHHTGIDAAAEGMAIIDAGHYGIEKIFVDDVGDYLRKKFPKMRIEKQMSDDPFQVL